MDKNYLIGYAKICTKVYKRDKNNTALNGIICQVKSKVHNSIYRKNNNHSFEVSIIENKNCKKIIYEASTYFDLFNLIDYDFLAKKHNELKLL